MSYEYQLQKARDEGEVKGSTKELKKIWKLMEEEANNARGSELIYIYVKTKLERLKE